MSINIYNHCQTLVDNKATFTDVLSTISNCSIEINEGITLNNEDVIIPPTVVLCGFKNLSCIQGIGTITISAMECDPDHQIFGDGVYPKFASGIPVRPEWFGNTRGSIIRAIDSLPDTGGTILLKQRDYDIVNCFQNTDNSFEGFIGNEKNNVKIIGSGMPIKSSDGTRFASGSGTVIQGAVWNFANGFEMHNLGVDSGSYVVGLSGKNFVEGLIAATHKLNKTYSDHSNLQYGIRINNVSILMKRGELCYGHGFLMSSCCNSSHGYIKIDGGYHGYVIKGIGISGETVHCVGQSLNSFIYKSDQYSECSNCQLGKIIIGDIDDIETPPGCFQAIESSDTKMIQIGDIIATNTSGVIRTIGSTSNIIVVSIGDIIGNNINSHGVVLSSNFNGFSLSKYIFKNIVGDAAVLNGATNTNIGSGIEL